MEVRESSGVTVVRSDAPLEYHIAARSENPSGSATAANPQVGVFPPPSTLKKKRGRPRKYGPDGFVTKPLSPKPISSAGPPPLIDFTAEKPAKIRSPVSAVRKQQPFKIEGLGDWDLCSVGASFTPHIITVNSGEDVTMKVISFSQEGPRAICILSANGVISSATLRQPDSSGGTLTYEGRFEILSLTGSFVPSESGGIRNRTGGMSISLACPDGRVFGGGVTGLLVAAAPVQIVVGSFLAGNQQELKPRKQKTDPIAHTVPERAVPVPAAETADPPAAAKQDLTSPSFRADSWLSYGHDPRNSPTDVNMSLNWS